MAWKTTSERLGEALDRARRHWQQQAPPAAPAEAPEAPAPPGMTIAISREAGAGGAAIARVVGARLGWPVYDHELLEVIATEMGLRAALLESVDERRKSWLRECLESLASGPAVSEGAYLRRLAEALLSLASHGHCVIVGRGAAQVLPAATTLRVRLVGPEEARVAAVMQRRGVTAQEAARWVWQTDRERARFVQDHFHKDAADPHLYDLVLNTARFTTAECTDLIVEALHRLEARMAVPAAVACL